MGSSGRNTGNTPEWLFTFYEKGIILFLSMLKWEKWAQMEKKRVCCFCESWESGGIESFLNNVLGHMDRTELEIDLVTSQLKESVFTKRLQEQGIHFYELSGNQKNIWKNHRLFRRLLVENSYDIIHLNVFQGMSLYYARLAKQAGVPVRIAHSHNTDLRPSRTRKLKLWLHKTFSNRHAADATAFWACSRAAAEFMFPHRVLEEKGFTFIPNGIRTERFHFDAAARDSVRRELGLEDCFVVGNVGRLCYQKNQEFLLDVFASLLKTRPDSRLLLVGEGEDRNKLESRAEELGIAENVLFYGVTDRVERMFWAMDAFAFPSRFEGLGIVAVEAQAAGLPVVCSEFVPPEAHVTSLAMVVPLEQSVQGWARALEAVTFQTAERMGKELVREAGFDIEDVAARIQTIWSRCGG